MWREILDSSIVNTFKDFCHKEKNGTILEIKCTMKIRKRETNFSGGGNGKP